MSCPVHGGSQANVASPDGQPSSTSGKSGVRSSEFLARFIETNRVCVRVAPEARDFKFTRNIFNGILNIFKVFRQSEQSGKSKCCEECFQSQMLANKSTFDHCQAVSFNCPCDCDPVVIQDKPSLSGFHNYLCKCRCEFQELALWA